MDQLDRLYDLLPTFDRQRDMDRGQPLRALLQVIAEQVNVVEADIEQLYANWFIETCQDWVVPYIGDLIGYQPVRAAGEPGDVATAAGRLRNKSLIPRREVAQTIHFRRRKGTLALLEELARDVGGWPAALAIEFHRHLVTSVNLAALQATARGRSVDVRNLDALNWIDRPFDAMAHTADVRSIASQRTPGRFNIPNVGLVIWRLKAYSASATHAHRGVDENCYTFSALGNTTPLFTNPAAAPASDAAAAARELACPIPVRRRTFARRRADYYGAGKSMLIWAENWAGQSGRQPVDVSAIVAADLSHWRYHPRQGFVAVDPELGRIAFAPNQLPRGVWVNYFYGAAADIGGGEYERALGQPAGARVYSLREGTPLAKVLEQWEQEAPVHAVIEIEDSGVYRERLARIVLPESHTLQIRAASGMRPVLRLQGDEADELDRLRVRCAPGSSFTLDGLLVTGEGLEIDGLADADYSTAALTPRTAQAATVVVRHATLVPGWALEPDGEPRHGREPSLVIANVRALVRIEHSIVGSLQVNQDEERFEPIPIAIQDSLIDATGPDRIALGGEDQGPAHACLTMQRSTVFGTVLVREVGLAENCIFRDPLTVSRTQSGCLRFCCVPLGSRTPRRYSCQPDLVERAAGSGADRHREAMRVRPQFESTLYGTPGYGRLHQLSASEIKRGADDESELGVFHDLFEAQRTANLRARLDEYTPAGASANLIFAE